MNNILIFGTSTGYMNLKNRINYSIVNVVGFIDNDKHKQGTSMDGKMIFSVEQIERLEYDYILIASSYYEEITLLLINKGVSSSRIIQFYKYESNEFLKVHQGKIAKILKQDYQKIVAAEMMMRKNEKMNINDIDYVRISSLELVSREIYDKSIEGAVAELGVFRGDFAKYINRFFKDKKFYLFDTFEGFDERDLKFDIESDFLKEGINTQFFSDTSIQLVLEKMNYNENCIVKKGYFPETAKGLNEKYAFVSIDADLFKPIYDGLVYFYPRLSKGGYIFIHDYNCPDVLGAREAVRKYCNENSISYFPLTDIYGTVVIAK